MLRAGSQGFSTRGLSVPWHYHRRAIAAQWHIPPWLVDEAPASEIMIELRIRSAEAKAR